MPTDPDKTVYPWLITHPDGSCEINMEGTTPAEADRRLVIAQEVGAGRVSLAATRVCPRCEGEGIVTGNDSRDPQRETDGPCDRCAGTGTVPR